VDWAENWRRKHATRAAHPVGQRDWDARAGRFARMTADLDPSREPFVRALAQVVKPTDRVLDVGAGAGRYALALARLAAQVTAVEPSAGMRAALEQAIADRQVANVSLVAGSWQEVQVEPHDVAVCAHVLYFVADI